MNDYELRDTCDVWIAFKQGREIHDDELRVIYADAVAALEFTTNHPDLAIVDDFLNDTIHRLEQMYTARGLDIDDGGEEEEPEEEPRKPERFYVYTRLFSKGIKRLACKSLDSIGPEEQQSDRVITFNSFEAAEDFASQVSAWLGSHYSVMSETAYTNGGLTPFAGGTQV